MTIVGKLSEDFTSIEILHNRVLKRVLRNYKGQDLEVAFRVLKYQRSSAQNRWLWGVAYVSICAWHKETTGEKMDKDTLHAHTLQYILDYRMQSKTINGMDVIVMQGKSTSALNTKEFSELVDKLCEYWNPKMEYTDQNGDVQGHIPLPKGNNMITDYVKDK